MARALDVFPARISTPGRVYERARVYAAAGLARIYVDDGGGQISLAASAEIGEGGVAISHSRREPHRISTLEGIWEVVKMGGCGCTEPLKRFRIPAG